MGSSKGTMRYVDSCRRTVLCRRWVDWERGLTAACKLGRAQELKARRVGRGCTAEEGEASEMCVGCHRGL